MAQQANTHGGEKRGEMMTKYKKSCCRLMKRHAFTTMVNDTGSLMECLLLCHLSFSVSYLLLCAVVFLIICLFSPLIHSFVLLLFLQIFRGHFTVNGLFFHFSFGFFKFLFFFKLQHSKHLMNWLLLKKTFFFCYMTCHN